MMAKFVLDHLTLSFYSKHLLNIIKSWGKHGVLKIRQNTLSGSCTNTFCFDRSL